MSLLGAVEQTVQEVLREVLAPELVERLTQRIMDQLQAPAEAAVADLIGLTGGRPGARGRPGRRRGSAGSSGVGPQAAEMPASGPPSDDEDGAPALPPAVELQPAKSNGASL